MKTSDEKRGFVEMLSVLKLALCLITGIHNLKVLLGVKLLLKFEINFWKNIYVLFVSKIN